jgi:glycosyltransferase involved in cell wall biosynthesis
MAPYPHVTCYVGNDLAEFDAGVEAHGGEIVKPDGEFWVMYAGTLGASYDLDTTVRAAAALAPEHPALRVKVLGDGPDRQKLEDLAAQLGAPVDFVGYTPYAKMAAYLSKCDVTLNSLVKDAPQSIVTKIGDYLASGKPMINTGSSPEMRAKVHSDGFGVNVVAEDAAELAGAIEALMANPEACAIMGMRARQVAEEQFDRPQSYESIVGLIESLL